MALLIKTTGIEQYAPGGTARVKVLLIGGPGAGKTRWSSFFPKPIYADCEAGLASVADRQVPYTPIKTSTDMLELLKFLKIECTKPEAQREYHTLVIDTLDAFQRKVKDEWIQKNPSAGGFKGYDAWGFLDLQMQMLMTRLLNLDMNIIVAVHYKDSKGTDEEPSRILLQLQGDLKDTAFNDFDFVGWMGTYWGKGKDEDGGRELKRGLTFRATPERPFLKDRLHVTPPWLDVEFADTDYTNLFSLLDAKASTLEASKEVGVIEIEPDLAAQSSGVVAPGASGSGALPAVDPKDIPIVNLDKPTLYKEALELYKAGHLTVQPKSNFLKDELVKLVTAGRAAAAAAPADSAQDSAASTPVEATPEPTPEPVTEPVAEVTPEPEPTPEPTPEPQVTPAETTTDAETGVVVNTETGEIVGQEPTATDDEAIGAIESLLGGEVISIQKEVEAPTSTPAPAAPKPAPTLAPAAATGSEKSCADCSKSLVGENPDFVRLAFIKHRKDMCESCYKSAKKS